MKRFLIRYFALTEDGARAMQHAILKTAINNLSMMLNFTVIVFFLQDALGFFRGESISFVKYLILIPLFVLIRYGTERLQYDAVYTATYQETSKIRMALAEKLGKLPLSFFEKKDLADLSKRILSDVEMLEHAFSHAVPPLFGAVISSLVIFVMMLFFSPGMAVATYWPLPFTLILIFLFKKKKVEGERKTYYAARAVSVKMQEMMENVTPIKAYGRKEKTNQELEDLLMENERLKMRTELLNPAILAPISSLYRMGMVTILLVGFYLVNRGSLPLFAYLQFIFASTLLYLPLEGMLGNLLEFFYIGSAVESIGEINHRPAMTGVKKDPKDLTYELKNVSFSYDGETPVIQDFSATIQQGEVTALVGPSGCGKSTLTKLLLRFYDADSGEIRLGGESLRDWDPEDLLKQIAMVFQDVILFNNTILENIRIGKKDATDEEVLRVAKLAQVDEFVQKLPQGYQTRIGEEGRLLSGGERQRISIARALLKDAPIIFLDESTSSVDADSESKIQAALSELVQGKTVIVIAHRLRTIMNADKILVLDEGRLVESGTADELLAQEGLYKKLCNLQRG